MAGDILYGYLYSLQSPDDYVGGQEGGQRVCGMANIVVQHLREQRIHFIAQGDRQVDKTVVIEILIEEKISCHPHNHDGSAAGK